MKKIQIIYDVLLDDDGYKKYHKFNMFLHNGYVCYSDKGVQKRIHRDIVNCPKEFVVDHINRNKLDNRKSNLRFFYQ